MALVDEARDVPVEHSQRHGARPKHVGMESGQIERRATRLLRPIAQLVERARAEFVGDGVSASALKRRSFRRYA